MDFLRAWFGIRVRSIARRDIGDVACALSQRSIARLSYVWPSSAMTGSAIRARVIGHVNSCINGAYAPAPGLGGGVLPVPLPGAGLAGLAGRAGLAGLAGRAGRAELAAGTSPAVVTVPLLGCSGRVVMLPSKTGAPSGGSSGSSSGSEAGAPRDDATERSSSSLNSSSASGIGATAGAGEASQSVGVPSISAASAVTAGSSSRSIPSVAKGSAERNESTIGFDRVRSPPRSSRRRPSSVPRRGSGRGRVSQDSLEFGPRRPYLPLSS